MISYIYYWYSLLYLIGKTSCVFLFASKIYDNSKYPINVIREIPTNKWCDDIERFLSQCRVDTMAFSGMKFFYLKRTLLLGVKLS